MSQSTTSCYNWKQPNQQKETHRTWSEIPRTGSVTKRVQDWGGYTKEEYAGAKREIQNKDTRDEETTTEYF